MTTDCPGCAAVLALHRPVPNHGRYSGERDCWRDCDHANQLDPVVCAECRSYAGDEVAYPCPTVDQIQEPRP